MRIAVLVNSLARPGGIAKHALRSSRELANMGHDVSVWTLEFDRERCYPEYTDGLDVHSVRPVGPATGDPRRLFGTRVFSYSWNLWRMLVELKRLSLAMPAGYDVVHPHGNQIIWAAYDYKRRHRTPVVWMCNDFWPMVSHQRPSDSSLMGQARFQAKRGLTLPFERYDRASVRAADRVVVLSSRVKAQMAQHYGVSPAVVRAGVDGWKFTEGDGAAIRNRHGISQDSLVLLTLSELMPRRRIEDVIGAVGLLASSGVDARYLVAGRSSSFPEYSSFLRAEVSRRKLEDRVLFTGELQEGELPDYFHACDAFVWVSDENQSWGLAGMEAMAAAKPLIVSRANGLAEVLEDRRTALVVEPRSPEAIATAVRRLRSDDGLARHLAVAGQDLVLREYSWRANAERMESLFERSMGAGRRSSGDRRSLEESVAAMVDSE